MPYMVQKEFMKLLILTFVSVLFSAACYSQTDWPQYRFNSARQSNISNSIPKNLQLKWARELGAGSPAWKGERWEENLNIDNSYQPVANSKIVVLPSMTTDSVSAYDVKTGALIWRFFADAPIRFAPILFNDKVIAGSNFYFPAASTVEEAKNIEITVPKKGIYNIRLIFCELENTKQTNAFSMFRLTEKP